MTEYVCRLGTATGEILEGIYAGESEDALRRDLERRDYLVLSMRRRSPLAAILRPSEAGRRRIKMKEFLIFNQELVSLVHAGLPIVDCLDILVERRKNPVFRKALTDIREQVRGGSALSEAFASQSDLFPPIYASTLASGERSGEIESVVRRYLKYLKTLLLLRKKVTSALVYPALLVTMSFVLVGVLIYWVLPNFSTFYREFGSEMPLLTEMLVGFAVTVRDHAWLLAAAALGAWMALMSWTRTQTGRLQLDRWKLRMPLVGRVMHKYSIANLARTLGTLIGGGIPLVQSLEIASQALTNSAFRSAVGGAAERVREGQPLWDSLERTGLMTDLAVEMIKVGESTGSLETMLGNVAEFYDEEIDNDLGTLVAIIEPAMLIFMGVFIALILLAIYLPLFKSYSSSQT
jgi:type IV pilus assembly protein PilC